MSSQRYPEEFRIEAVRQITEHGHTVADVSRRLGVSTHSLYKWLQMHQMPAAMLGQQQSQAEELRRLKTDAKDMLGYKHSGFSVDAGVCIEAHDRAALERLLRYCARPPFSMERLCPLTFLDVPEQAYSRATLGVYEMTRVELLRDLYVWAYERSTQEYLAIKQDLAEPDPLRLAWRDFIKQTILDVITQPTLDPLICIQSAVEQQVPKSEQAGVLALIVEELRRLHEGVLARYGLRPSQYSAWKAVHGH